VYAIDKMEALDREGKISWSKNGYPGLKHYLDESDGERVPDIWDDITIASGTQQLNYPTQKPEALLERILETSSNEGDLVADFFCGSGTTAAVAEKLGRRWIVSDIGKLGVHTTRKRLLGLEGARAFEVLRPEGAFTAGPGREAIIEVQPRVNGKGVSVELTGFSVSWSDETVDDAALKKRRSRVVVEQSQIVKLSRDRDGVVKREILTEHWTDWIDYWSVDFDFQQVFENEWRSFRTRRDRSLGLTSDLRECRPGPRRIAVKVVDVFGNDTTTTLDVDVGRG
jgi:hypothetical protein